MPQQGLNEQLELEHHYSQYTKHYQASSVARRAAYVISEQVQRFNETAHLIVFLNENRTWLFEDVYSIFYDPEHRS